SGEVLGLLIAELEHNLDLPIREYAHIRRVLFREEPVQALALFENRLPFSFLLLGKLLTSFYFLFMFGSERNYLILGREPADLKSTFSTELRIIRNSLLGLDLFNCVNANRFAPSFLAHAMQMNDGYSVADFEHF